MSASPGAIPAAASSALETVLAGPRRRAERVGAASTAVYLQPDEGPMVAVVTRAAVRLPNALVVEAAGVAAVARAARASIGAGVLVAGRTVLAPQRWFDPRPHLAPTTGEELARRLDELAAVLPPWHAEASAFRTPLRRGSTALAAALVAGDARGIEDAARLLVGLGPGLTPAGDDVVAGALAALRLLAPAVGTAEPAALAEALARAAEGAAGRTAALSAALLQHAARGEVAAPAAQLLRALAGRGAVRAAAGELLRVGHSSGHDLARGILAGGHGVVARAPVTAEAP